MKTSRITLAKSVLVALLLMGFSSSALAETRINIGFGFGSPRFNRTQRQHQRSNRNRRNQRLNRQPSRLRQNRRQHSPRRENIILSGGFRYNYRWPNYYVVAAPTIIRRSPVIVEEKTVVVSTSSPQVTQPVAYDEDTQLLFETLRHKKQILLKQLQTGDEEQRKDAIKELAGFSFDDTVRLALENVLLSDPDAELRKEAIKAFAEVKNTKALAALEKARVEDSRQDVRKEADEAIKSIKGN